MEGVGARLGRSSARYGPTPVFTGPVRKWKKKWVHVPDSSNNNRAPPAGSEAAAHLLLFKWTPTQTKDGNNDTDNGNAEPNKDDALAPEGPPRRRFKYIPMVVLEEEKGEPSEQMEDDMNAIDNRTSNVEATSKSEGNDENPNINDVPNINNVEATSKSEGHDEKPNINDVSIDENQAVKKSPVERQDLNVSTLDLSLGLNAQDGENDSDSKGD